MQGMRRGTTIVPLAAGLMLVGGSSASAWIFANKTHPQQAIYNGASFGDGAGSIYREGFSTVKVVVDLRDPVPTNGRRAYQKTTVYKPFDSSWTPATVQTGRRSESNTWGRMATQKINTVRSSYGHHAKSVVCEDASLRPDIRSTTRSSGL